MSGKVEVAKALLGKAGSVISWCWNHKLGLGTAAVVTAATVDQVANDGNGTRAAGEVAGKALAGAGKAAKDAGRGFFTGLSESLGGFGMIGALIGGGIGLMTGGFTSLTGILLTIGLAVGGYALASSFSGDKGSTASTTTGNQPRADAPGQQRQQGAPDQNRTADVTVGAPPPRVNAPNHQPQTARQP